MLTGPARACYRRAMPKTEMTAHIHVKCTDADLAAMKHAAGLVGTDDFSSWVREILRRAAKRILLAKGERPKGRLSG